MAAKVISEARTQLMGSGFASPERVLQVTAEIRVSPSPGT
jgi:hypothetical protein